MALTITIRALQRRLTTVAAVKRALGETDSGQDELLGALIDAASAAIEDAVHQPLARAAYSETVRGYGDLILQLARAPIVLVTSVANQGEPITDHVIEDAEAGWLYREKGWNWTAGLEWYLDQIRPARSETPDFTVVYTAGWLLPSDDLTTAAVSVAAIDKSFNLTSGTWPLLVAGDVIETSQFTTAGNNGRFTVVTRTAAKVTVAETLTDESASVDAKSVVVRTLPASIEQATLDTVKAWYLARTRDPEIKSKQVGDLSITYRDATAGQPTSLLTAIPMTAMALLTPYMRAA